MKEGEDHKKNAIELDPARRAEATLSAIAETEGVSDVVEVLDGDLRKLEEVRDQQKEIKAQKTAQVTEVTTERTAAPVVSYESTRNESRLLLVSGDVSILEADSVAAGKVRELARVFAEVHVIVLSEGRGNRKDIARMGEDVWVYQTDSRSWWRTIFDARTVAGEQLVFGDGFRADIIIATDAFEAGVAGYLIGKRYNRPLQVHINTDFFYDGFKKASPDNSWRLSMANFVMKRTNCVRTTSAYIQNRILERYKKLKGKVELLPVFHDLNEWVNTPVSFDLKDEYPQFKFTLLHISNMNALAHTEVVIDGLFYLLKQYASMGLVIIGDGERRAALEKTILEYGLQDRIVFGSPDTDLLSCMKSAQVLIHTSEDPSEDELVLKAAAVGLPIVCGNRGLASEFFIDEESVLLCPLNSPECFGEKVNRLLNDNRLRQQLSLNARDVVFSSIEQDYGSYLTTYRASIEGCLVAEEEK